MTLSHKKMLAHVDKDIHFALVTNWKQPKCPSGGEWVYKSQFINAMACYPVVKENKEDLNEWVQKALQDTLSGEKKNKSEKHTHCMILCMF